MPAVRRTSARLSAIVSMRAGRSLAWLRVRPMSGVMARVDDGEDCKVGLVPFLAAYYVVNSSARYGARSW